jgi:RNA polymerase sigma factor (TIGR02999 family)
VTTADVTQLLKQWADGNRAALDALMPVLYGELRSIADAYLRREREGHTLQPTALVHEAWIRLVGTTGTTFEHREQFFGLAAQMMRRILVDHARRSNARKRGGGAAATTVQSIPSPPNLIDDLLALDQALDRLAQLSPRQARVVELRHFAGLGVEEIGRLLEVSPATISRDQKAAEAWLCLALGQ